MTSISSSNGHNHFFWKARTNLSRPFSPILTHSSLSSLRSLSLSLSSSNITHTPLASALSTSKAAVRSVGRSEAVELFPAGSLYPLRSLPAARSVDFRFVCWLGLDFFVIFLKLWGSSSILSFICFCCQNFLLCFVNFICSISYRNYFSLSRQTKNVCAGNVTGKSLVIAVIVKCLLI